MLPKNGQYTRLDNNSGDLELGHSVMSPMQSEHGSLAPVVSNVPATQEFSTVEIYSRLASYLWIDKNIPKIIQASGLTALTIACNLLIPTILAKTVESLNTGKPVNILGIALESNWSILAFVIAVASAQLLPAQRDKLLMFISQTTAQKVLTDLSDYMLHKNMDYHRNTEDGDKTFVIGKGFNVAGSAQSLLTEIIPTVFEIALASGMLCYQYGLEVGLGLMGIMAVYTTFSYLSGPTINAHYELSQESGAETWGMVTRVPKQYKMIWDFNHVDRTLKQISDVTQKTADIIIKAASTAITVNQIQILIASAGMLMAALYMGQRIKAGQSNYRDFLTLMTYLTRLSNSLPAFGAAINNLLASNPSVKLVFEKLSEQKEVVDLYPNTPLIIEGLPTIEFRNVTFGYPVRYSPCIMSLNDFLESQKPRVIAIYLDEGKLNYSLKANGVNYNGTLTSKDLPRHYDAIFQKVSNASQPLNEEERKAILKVSTIQEYIVQEPRINILNNISFTLNPVQLCVLVSESGAGKSSIFDLLYRYYDPLSGAIFINGQNIAEVSLTSLREQITLFRQESLLFHGTIRANIQYGAQEPDAVTDAMIMEAAQALGLKVFLETKGLDTFIGDTLSGGDKQKIAMIRGFLKNGKICLFDEVTNGLDADVAEQISMGVRAVKTTQMVITHKLAEVVEHADCIIVLDKATGTIAAQGTHDELCDSTTEGAKFYQRLWEKQNKSSKSMSPTFGNSSLFHHQERKDDTMPTTLPTPTLNCSSSDKEE